MTILCNFNWNLTFQVDEVRGGKLQVNLNFEVNKWRKYLYVWFAR